MAEFYLDNDVSLDLVPPLIAAGHHVVATRDLSLFRAADDAQLLTAARNRWVLITYNRRDFVMLHDAWVTWPAAFGVVLPPHPGILTLDPASPETLAQAVTALVAALPAGSLDNACYWWHRRDGWRRRLVGSGWEPFP